MNNMQSFRLQMVMIMPCSDTNTMVKNSAREEKSSK